MMFFLEVFISCFPEIEMGNAASDGRDQRVEFS